MNRLNDFSFLRWMGTIKNRFITVEKVAIAAQRIYYSLIINVKKLISVRLHYDFI